MQTFPHVQVSVSVKVRCSCMVDSALSVLLGLSSSRKALGVFSVICCCSVLGCSFIGTEVRVASPQCTCDSLSQLPTVCPVSPFFHGCHPAFPGSHWRSQVNMMMYTVRTAYHRRLQPSSHLSSGVSPLISEHPPDGGAAVLIRHCSSVMAATLVHCVEARANWTPSPQPCLELGLSIYVPCP